jgi:hypothetical protein
LNAQCPYIQVATHFDRLPVFSGPPFILIDKDRRIKLREQKFVSEKALFATIDATPMRQSEIKAKTAR